MDGVATSDPQPPRDYARQPTSPWRNDNHGDVTEKREEGADMRIAEIFSLGGHHHGDNDRRWHEDSWRNDDYDNRNWRYDNWDGRRHGHRGNC
ncbi:MAG: hypothetical protein WBR33_01745 [Pseudonocardiaceae bacterium]